MMLAKVLLCVTFAVFAADVSAISGGRWAKIGESPYQVALINSTGHFFCGGAILNANWILTVSSCIKNVDDIVVQAGSRFLDGESETRAQSVRVKEKVFLRKHFRHFAPALLKLEKPLELNPVTESVFLPSEEDVVNDGDNVTFGGWGPTLLAHSGQSNNLKIAEKKFEKCSYPEQFCVIGKDGNACVKDHGGPVVITKNGKKIVVGVIAEVDSYPCGKADGWFTAGYIYKYSDLIKSKIREHDTAPEEFLPSTPFKELPAEYTPVDLRVSNCTSSPCVVQAGTVLYAEWDFIVRRNTSTLSHFIYSPNFEYDITPHYTKDICSSLKNVKCPLSKGDVATFSLKMPVYTALSGITTDLQICFDDDKGYTVFCFAIAVDIRYPDYENDF